jgi:hypothetical protein
MWESTNLFVENIQIDNTYYKPQELRINHSNLIVVCMSEKNLTKLKNAGVPL